MELSNEKRIPEYCVGKKAFYHKGEYIYDLFAEMASKYPENTAVIAEGTEYSYAEIKKLIDNTSAYLYKCGIRAGDRVAVTGIRNIYTVVSIYALIKLGAAYVPLEDNYPKKRVEYILDDCGANKLILTNTDFEFVPDDIETIDLSKKVSDERSYAEIPADKMVDPCCYIIYTSGTTGQPKGTAIRSDDLLNLVYWYIDELSLNDQCRVLLLNAFGFDASVKNIFAPLLVGGTLILGSRDLYNIDSILGIMRTYRPTVVNCVPGLFSALTEADREKNYNAVSSLEYAVVGGERLNNSWAIQLYKDISESKLKVLNVYGPTECTSVSSSMKYTLRELAECENVLSGRPIYNKRIYILDDKGNVLPKGEKGEIVISGVGIADNYICHNPPIKFVQTLQKLYKLTGRP